MRSEFFRETASLRWRTLLAICFLGLLMTTNGVAGLTIADHSVGKNRKFDTHGEHQQTIDALLAAMDGFDSSQGIVVVAATNRPEDLDDALLRPGRFDRKVYVPYPDMKGRRAILKAHAEGKPILEEQTALDIIAQTTPGMSGADLANLLNEAAILCAQRDTGRDHAGGPRSGS